MPEQNRMPWRSVRLPQLLTLIALAVGLPLFLRSPPWCDITLYQLAARNLVHGGVHYRDLFDTNLPGYVWIVTAIYWLCGPNTLVLRLVDLAVVAGIVALGDRCAKWGGASAAARWWAVAGAALFYPFVTEGAHAQRDAWMLLPALAATALRVRRGAANARPFRASVLEGALWGAAVWIKPHVVPVALAVWLVTVRRAGGAPDAPRRAAPRDLLGNLCGGLAVGAAGLAWLVLSGAWGPFLEVMLEWNPLYLKMDGADLGRRAGFQLYWFPPWTYFQPLTVLLAVASVLDAAPWARRTDAERGPVGARLPAWLWGAAAAPPAARFARGALAALLLAWLAQGLFVQRELHYVHIPETLLAFALWAAHRWCWVLPGALYLAACGAVWLVADAAPPVRAVLDSMGEARRDNFVPRHPLFDPPRLAAWPDCWRLAMSDADRYRHWDRLRTPVRAEVIGWEELNEVADYLRSRGAGDGAVIGWHDSPHAVYLILDAEPGFRFMHVFMAFMITDGADDPVMRDIVLTEMRRAERVRFVISDLEWVVSMAPGAGRNDALIGPPVSPADLLPANRPRMTEFPFTQPTVFRSKGGTGRYVVHELRDRTGARPLR